MPSISSEILLLALDDQKGSVRMNFSTTLDIALAGGQLMELAMAGRVTIEDKRVIAHDGPPLEDPILQASFARIQEQDKPKKADNMIAKLTKGLRKRMLAQLAEQGVVRVEERKMFGLIPRNRYPEVNGTVEDAVRHRLRAVILHNQVPDERTAALAVVIQAADLQATILNRAERRASKQRLKELARGAVLSPAIASAVASAKAAAYGC